MAGQGSGNANVYSDVCYEIDRQIKETLVRRENLQREILRVRRNVEKQNALRTKNKEKHTRVREEYTNELDILEGRYNLAVYAFREPVTQEFTRLQACFHALCTAFAKAYDGTPPSGELLIPYKPIGDMLRIRFSTEPLCILLGEDIFCVVPCYIVRFKKSGAYVSTYFGRAIRGWVTSVHTAWNILVLDIVGCQLRYEVEESVKNTLLAAIAAYSVVLPIKPYDPAPPLIRLLKECGGGNSNIEKLERMIDRGPVSTHKDILSKRNSQFQNPQGGAVSNFSTAVMLPERKWNTWDVIKMIFCTGVGSIIGFVASIMSWGMFIFAVNADWFSFLILFGIAGLLGLAAYLLIRKAVRTIRLHARNPYIPNRNPVARIITILMAAAFAASCGIGFALSGNAGSNADSLDEQAIEQITAKWETDGTADYTDVAVFEEAVNNGEDLVGKTVTFTVVEVRPDAALGHNLWGGEQLNFVSDEDPGIQAGDKITVIVTGVKRLLVDGYRITYILLEPAK